MDLTRTLLGRNGCADESLLSGVVLNDRFGQLKIGQPIIITKSSYETKGVRISGNSKKLDSILAGKSPIPEDSHPVVSYLYFIQGNIGSIRSSLILEKNDIILTDPKGIIVDRRIKTIEEFDFRKSRKIADFVRQENAVSFLIKDKKSCINFLTNIDKLVYDFPITSYCGKVSSPPSGPGNLAIFVNIYNLPYCIPVFSRGKINGIGVHIGLYHSDKTEKSGVLHGCTEIFILLSDYSENVLVVDGSTIRQLKPIPSDLISYMRGLIEKDIKSKKQPTIEESTKDKVPSVSDLSSIVYSGPSTLINTIDVSDFSSTAPVYYTYTTTSLTNGTGSY